MRRRVAGRTTARPDDRHWRLQQQQYVQSGAHLRAAVPTFHVAEPACLVSSLEIRHKPVGGKDERLSAGWLPPFGPVSVGLTSGASTPDNLVGTVIRRLDAFANLVNPVNKTDALVVLTG
jgi:hypothetical protein